MIRTLALLAAVAAAPVAVALHASCVAVIAHRGASGYLPEHTLPAYALAYGQGAHWIEPDVVLTADGVPIALHDETLNRTTNAAEVFPTRGREDGLHYAADFAWGEVRELSVVDATLGRYPHATFRVPRLRKVLELVEGLNRTTGRRVGVYPELKGPSDQPGLGDAVLEELSGFDLPVLIQSFDGGALAALETNHPRVQLIGREPPTDADLAGIAAYAVAIGVYKGQLVDAPAIVARANQRGLGVHAFTLRADQVGEGFASFAAEAEALIALGVDAIFTDHPDRLLTVVGPERTVGCESVDSLRP